MGSSKDEHHMVLQNFNARSVIRCHNSTAVVAYVGRSVLLKVNIAECTKKDPCYGALAMCMKGCAGLPTPSQILMYHTLVVAPAFLATFTGDPCATVLRYDFLSYKISATCTVPYDRA
jgi:hypothetical protein